METEKPVWTTDHISMLLHEMRNDIPEKMRKRKWTEGMKALDWKKIAFEPFSPEECQQKWQEILQTISKVRTLPELIVAAEDGISHPFGRNIINPEYPKQPATGYVRFYKENFAKLKKNYPNVSHAKLAQRAANKYKMLPEEEKQKYEENYKLAKEEYKRRVVEFRKRHKEVAVSKLPRSGFSLFCQEQHALIGDVSTSNCRIKWTTRWQNLTESQRKEYCRRCKELKNDQEEKQAKDSLLFHKLPRNGYGLFCHEQHGLMGDIPFTNYPTVWRQRWGNLTETQRDKYHRQFKEMKREHAIKLNEFLEDFDVKKQVQILKKSNLKRPELPKGKRRKEVTRFPGEPKRPPCSAHTMFCTEQMKHFKEIETSKQRFSVINQMWRHMSKSEKAPYEEKLEERVLQYSVELQRWFKTLTPVEQEQYLTAHPSRHSYLWDANTPVDDDGEVSQYHPSDSEDEDLEDSSSEDDVVIVEDEEEDDVIMFEMF
uniref:HMG box domain-containing protein n=1 Tax=Sphaeramia orbicularis TaxID=375764 RepID=A0A673C1U4_9TELE